MRFRGARLWPAILVTLITGAGFAGLKFVLIGEIALAFDLKSLPTLPFAWMERILHRSIEHDTLREALSQGLAAVLTLGVLIGYAINAPLAGAWRCSWLFSASCAGVAAGTLATLWFNNWVVAFLVGIAYGAACAARGKVIPLLSRATGRPNTLVSGMINASLVIGLLGGTVLGTALAEKVELDSERQSSYVRHAILFIFMVGATLLSLFVRPPEPRRTAFVAGVRELATGTATMLRQQWALLVGGGLAWGIASAASLAVYIDAIDPQRLALDPTKASFMAVFAATGAIIGNLASHRWSRRSHVMASLVALAVCIAVYPHIIHTWWTGAAMMIAVGALFAAPANILDARLLAIAGRDGMAGRGSTVMSLVHNVFIFLVGCGLAIPLFLGVMSATEQFYFLAAISLLTVWVSSRARLDDVVEPVPARSIRTRSAAASTGVAS